MSLMNISTPNNRYMLYVKFLFHLLIHLMKNFFSKGNVLWKKKKKIHFLFIAFCGSINQLACKCYCKAVVQLKNCLYEMKIKKWAENWAIFPDVKQLNLKKFSLNFFLLLLQLILTVINQIFVAFFSTIRNKYLN